MSGASILKDLKILPMTQNDLEDVLTIERFSFPLPWPRSQFEQELHNQFSHLFTARIIHEGREIIVAYIIFWIVADQAHILNIATHPEFRRRGIAKNLLVFILRLLKEREVREVFLEVRKSNVNARRLYAGFAFKEIGVRKGYYGNNKEDAIVMTLAIHEMRKVDFEKEKG